MPAQVLEISPVIQPTLYKSKYHMKCKLSLYNPEGKLASKIQGATNKKLSVKVSRKKTVDKTQQQLTIQRLFVKS